MSPRRQRLKRRRGRRPGPRPGRRRFHDRLLGALWRTVFVLLIAGGLSGLCVGGVCLWDFTQNSEFFRLREIAIDGVGPGVETEMRALLADLVEGGGTLFSVSPRLVQARLSSHPRLEPTEIRVHRRWPDSLSVSAAERHPAATVAGPRLMLLDAEGWILEQGPAAVADADLPLLTGLDASDLIYGERVTHRDAHCLLTWLAALRHHLPRTHRRLSELHIDEVGEVTAHLIGGTVIRLGDRGPLEQLPVLLTFTREIESDLTRLALVDLRMDDHLVYRRLGTGAQTGPH